MSWRGEPGAKPGLASGTWVLIMGRQRMQISPEESSFYIGKIKKMKTTAYVRFDLSERLANVEYINIIVSILMTMYLSGWAIFVKFYPDMLSSWQQNTLSFMSVMASITLLCMTILDHASSRSVKSKLFLDSGNRILNLADELELANP